MMVLMTAKFEEKDDRDDIGVERKNSMIEVPLK